MAERSKTKPLIHPNLSETANPALEFAEGIMARINHYDQETSHKPWPFATITLKMRHPVDIDAYKIIKDKLGLNQRGETFKGIAGTSAIGNILEITRTSRNNERPTVAVFETRELIVDVADRLAQPEVPILSEEFEMARLVEIRIEIYPRDTTFIDSHFKDHQPEKIGPIRRLRHKLGL